MITYMHARDLDEEKDGMKGYICVNRSVWEDENTCPSDDFETDSSGDTDFIRMETLLGVNFMRELEGNKCDSTVISHVFTPVAPPFGAKQFGLKASANFLKCLQSHPVIASCMLNVYRSGMYLQENTRRVPNLAVQ